MRQNLTRIHGKPGQVNTDRTECQELGIYRGFTRMIADQENKDLLLTCTDDADKRSGDREPELTQAGAMYYFVFALHL
jgi:hypothetical protein